MAGGEGGRGPLAAACRPARRGSRRGRLRRRRHDAAPGVRHGPHDAVRRAEQPDRAADDLRRDGTHAQPVLDTLRELLHARPAAPPAPSRTSPRGTRCSRAPGRPAPAAAPAACARRVPSVCRACSLPEPRPAPPAIAAWIAAVRICTLTTQPTDAPGCARLAPPPTLPAGRHDRRPPSRHRDPWRFCRCAESICRTPPSARTRLARRHRRRTGGAPTATATNCAAASSRRSTTRSLADSDPARLPEATRIALLQMDPRNVTLEPEYYAEIDVERYARVKPLIWLWEMFDKSPLGENVHLGVRFRRMLAPHIFKPLRPQLQGVPLRQAVLRLQHRGGRRRGDPPPRAARRPRRPPDRRPRVHRGLRQHLQPHARAARRPRRRHARRHHRQRRAPHLPRHRAGRRTHGR
jgi:hypothetical protein